MVTWAPGVVPSGVSFSIPDMSLMDMRLATVSEEAVNSDGSKPMAVDTSHTIGFRSDGPGHYNPYVVPPSGGPSCWVQTVACRPVTSASVVGSSADTAQEAY